MRIKLKEKIKPIIGNKRIIEKFLWFPKKINLEIRWLERAKIEQECRWCLYEPGISGHYWSNLKFIKMPSKKYICLMWENFYVQL